MSGNVTHVREEEESLWQGSLPGEGGNSGQGSPPGKKEVTLGRVVLPGKKEVSGQGSPPREERRSLGRVTRVL